MPKKRITQGSNNPIAASVFTINKNILAAEKLYRRKPDSVIVLAVSKQQTAEDVRQAFDAGIHDFGESYTQEFLTKQEKLIDLPLIWHFIGPIQSNKSKIIAQNFAWVHSLDRLDIAHKLNQYRPIDQPPINICVQINLDQETSKSGLHPQELDHFIHQLSGLDKIRLRGLMCLPVPETNESKQYQNFMRLTALFNQVNAQLNSKMDTLSMGMTMDYIQAIHAGSTIIRIGRGLFHPVHPQGTEKTS